MAPNQSPLASILNLFKGSSSSPPSLPNRGGGFPGFGGPPGRVGGFPGPGARPGGGGFLGFGGPPSGGGGAGGFPGIGGSSSSGGGLFGLGNIAKNLGKVDVGKVMDGVNNFRNMMANAQKVASTLNQLGITVGNVQKFMKQVDINGLMNLLGSGDGGGSGDMSTDSPAPEEPSSPTKKAPVRRKKARSKARKKGTKKRTTTSGTRKRKKASSTPLIKKQ